MCPRCGAVHAGEPCLADRTLAFAPAADLWPAGPAALATPPRADPLLGAKVGSFHVVRMLGRGGMGTVYLAEHPAIGSKVAVKFLHESLAADAQVVARFYDEARAVNLIGHENIVGVYDLSVLPPDRYYYVMEYLDGDTLAAGLRAGPLAPAIAVDVLLQLCDALQCAHERGVVHRDLKPENVFLVARRGRPHFVKLVDFGIAKLRDADATSRTTAGLIVGTPDYMAPEQCDDGAIDARTDVYALGVMAFELATGRLPFVGQSIPQLLLAHLRTAPPRPSELAPVDAELERVILRALEKEPARRFQDMAAFAEALRPIAARLAKASSAGPSPSPIPTPTPTSTPTPTPTPTPTSTPTPDPLSSLSVELRAAGAAPRRLPAVELTRAGLFLRADGVLPPLFSRVAIAVSHPSLRAPLALSAEVVRHVSPAEAAAWRMAPGFGLQLVDVAPEARAALAELADSASRREPAPPAVPPSAGAAGARLAALEARARGSHYDLLGLPRDAAFAEVRRAARLLHDELDALSAHPLAADHPARTASLLGRLDAARAALGAAPSRLAYDAAHGNWRGVLVCRAAGVPAALLEERRGQLLAAEPARAAEAARQLARSRVAAKLGNPGAAAAALEAALAADPLDAAALDGYLALRRG